MLLPLLVSLLAADSVGTPDIQAPAVGRVKLVLNQDGYFYPGDRVQLQVSSTDDGYLVVFRATTRGRVRVLFPLDPGDDAFLRGGKKYDVEDRSGQQTFRIDDEEGTGVIYAAISDEPFDFSAFARGDHWDYRAFGDYQVTDDAEAEFADLMEKLTPNASYQFDLVTYHAGSASNYSSYGHSHYNDVWSAPCFGCDGYYGGSGLSVSLSFGYPYYYSSWYSPWYFGYYPAYGPYYSNCYYVPCYGYGYGYPYHPYYGGGYYGGGYYGGGYGGGYNGRPPYQFKPGQPVTPVGYRPRTTVAGPAIGVHPRGREPFTSTTGGTQPSPRITPVTHRDDRTPVGTTSRRRVGVEDRSPRRQLSDAPRTSRPVSTVDRSGRVAPSRSDGGDSPSRAQGSPRRQPSDRSAQGRGEPSNRGEARGSAPSRREAPPSYGGSGGGGRQSSGGGGGYRGGGGGGARPSGGAPMRRP